MRLHESQRSALAERICRRWIRRRGIRMAAPKVYVIRSSRDTAGVWGTCWWTAKRSLILYLGRRSNKRDHYILLAHEFAHALDAFTARGKWAVIRRKKFHGERFQRLLWGLIPRGLWKRAATPRWGRDSSRHRPEFQPD